MAFHVDITEPALSDAEDYVRFIRDVKNEPEAAEQWFRGLVHLIHFSHRIISCVEREKKRVVIYRVYHASRQRLAEGDL